MRHARCFMDAITLNSDTNLGRLICRRQYCGHTNWGVPDWRPGTQLWRAKLGRLRLSRDFLPGHFPHTMPHLSSYWPALYLMNPNLDINLLLGMHRRIGKNSGQGERKAHGLVTCKGCRLHETRQGTEDQRRGALTCKLLLSCVMTLGYIFLSGDLIPHLRNEPDIPSSTE